MKTKNLPLIIGIALPILFIIAVMIAVFIPSLYVNPQHNFIYGFMDNSVYYPPNAAYVTYSNYRNTYQIVDGRLALKPTAIVTKDQVFKGDEPVMYEYDVKDNTSHEISLADAQALMVDPGPSSQDGYTVSYQYGRGDFFDLFGSGGEESGYFISKGNAQKRLTALGIDQYRGSENFTIIGWVK